MVKLRLKRLGRKFTPHYRIVAIQARTKREGKTLEDLGHYSPITKEIVLKKDRIEYWLSVGAQPTDTVKGLLIKEEIVKADKYKKTYSKTAKKKSQERSQQKEDAKKAAAEASKEAEAKPEAEKTEETKAE